MCSCGNIRYYTAAELTAKEKQPTEPSCGCVSRIFGRSWWEMRIVAKIVSQLGEGYDCIYESSPNGRGAQYTIQYVDDDGRQYCKKYDLAIFGKVANFIVECNGAVWHARSADQLNEDGSSWTTVKGVGASDVYYNDQFKRTLAEQHGFRVLYIWDDEDEETTINNIAQTIRQANEKF